MTEDAGTTRDPPAPGIGERRRALQAERDRQAGRRNVEVPPPTPPADPSDPESGPDRVDPEAAGHLDGAERGAGVRPPPDAVGHEPEAEQVEVEPRSDRAEPDAEPDAHLLADESTAGQPYPWVLGVPAVPLASPPAPPETAAPGWSAVTPVIPVDPLPYDSASSGGWEHVSVRRDDDDAWLRRLREPEPEPEPDAAVEDEPGSDDGLEAETGAQFDADDERASDEADEVEALSAAGESPAAPAQRPAFRRASARRLSEALARASDEDRGGLPDGDHDEATPEPPGTEVGPRVDDEEPLRGTLAPVLRRSTERTRYPTSTVPVIHPPVLPPEPGEPPAAGVLRDPVTTWDEAVAGHAVAGRKARVRGWHIAQPRHESGGAGEYRPRGSPDRSLTLLVVGMLLVLVALVAVAVWAFWPRATGAGSLPEIPAAVPATSGPG